MMELGINAPMGETVHQIGTISFVRTQGPAESPTYEVVHDDDEGEPFCRIYKGRIRVFYAEMDGQYPCSGPIYTAIGDFLNALTEHYKGWTK